MPNPTISFGYVRAEAVSGQPGSMILSGLILNSGATSAQFVMTISFTGEGGFATGAFSLPQGTAAAFSYLIGVPFAGAHSGTVVMTGTQPASSSSSPFESDPSTEALGFQIFIFGHPMPDTLYPSIPSTTYAVEDLP